MPSRSGRPAPSASRAAPTRWGPTTRRSAATASGAKKCGGHLFNEHPTWGVIDVYAELLPDLRFQPQLHVNYAETVLRMQDGLPKQKDMPKDMGGSGVLLPE